jgi:SAM-dependent methyltransferase
MDEVVASIASMKMRTGSPPRISASAVDPSGSERLTGHRYPPSTICSCPGRGICRRGCSHCSRGRTFAPAEGRSAPRVAFRGAVAASQRRSSAAPVSPPGSSGIISNQGQDPAGARLNARRYLFWNTDVVRVEEQYREFGEWERAAWEQCAVPYAASLGDLTRGSVGSLLDAAAAGPGTRLLDVGTGPGFVARAAIDRGAVVCAVDQSAAMVQIARAGGVDAVESGAEALPFDADTFDAVVGGYVLNHLPRPVEAIAEFRRVLGSGGRLAMTIWDLPSANSAIGLFGPVVTDLGLTAVVPTGPDAYLFCDDTRTRNLLAGWEGVRLERMRWSINVAPGAWFDAVADATPRTGAVLAQAGPVLRAKAQQRYVEEATRDFGADRDGMVTLPAAAVLISATKPATES